MVGRWNRDTDFYSCLGLCSAAGKTCRAEECDNKMLGEHFYASLGELVARINRSGSNGMKHRCQSDLLVWRLDGLSQRRVDIAQWAKAVRQLLPT